MYREARGKSAGVAPMRRKTPDLKTKKREPKTKERAKAERTAVEASSFDFSRSFFPKSTEILFPAPAPKSSPKA